MSSHSGFIHHPDRIPVYHLSGDFSVIQSFSAENERNVFFNPGLPGFGLLGLGKIVSISSLPARCKGLKCSFQDRHFIQPGLKFRGYLLIAGFFEFHFQPGLLHFHGFL
jgi:hypothetical protein